MGKKPALISALPPLSPEFIVDMKTGELVDTIEFDTYLTELSSFVQSESKRLWEDNKTTLKTALESITATSPAEVGRQAGLVINWESISRDVKAKSRVERLIRYNTITSARSYFESPVKTKQEPNFTPLLNLGAVDAQMAKLTLNGENIELSFKCWDREFLLTFRIPSYVLEREITKLSLPVVKPWGGSFGFIFSVVENPATLVTNPKYIMGVDLGRVEPYTLVVIHASSGSRAAQYTASPRLRHLIAKRDRLNEELGYLRAKSLAYAALVISREVLETERERTRTKRNRLMNKITWLIATEINTVAKKYSPQYVALEDLSWVNPKHGMSRWTHSKDQTAITHKLTRSGVPTKKVSPKNTSQECSKCGSKVTHKPGKRMVVCGECVLTFDRDVNAAVNIALRPLRKRSKGNNSTVITEVIVTRHSDKRLLTRNTS